MSEPPAGKGPDRRRPMASAAKGSGAQGPGGTGPHDFSRRVGAKAAQKLRAQRDGTHGVWFGLGMMGLVGWSVVVPTLLGAALGIQIDNRYTGGPSWTLSLLVVGLVLGCVNAWYWVRKEERAMGASQENDDD